MNGGPLDEMSSYVTTSAKSPKKRVRFADAPEEIPYDVVGRQGSSQAFDVSEAFVHDHQRYDNRWAFGEHGLEKQVVKDMGTVQSLEDSQQMSTPAYSSLACAGAHNSKISSPVSSETRFLKKRKGDQNEETISAAIDHREGESHKGHAEGCLLRNEDASADVPKDDDVSPGVFDLYGSNLSDLNIKDDYGNEAGKETRNLKAFLNEESDILRTAEAADPVEAFNDMGIPFEPFNLKREREEGYFDPISGSYVLYDQGKKPNEIADDWVDTLPDNEQELHAMWKSKGNGDADIMKRINIMNEAQSEGLHSKFDMQSNGIELDNMKQTIADLLNPGETVVGALCRLGSLRISSSQTLSSQASPTRREENVGTHQDAELHRDKVIGPVSSNLQKSRIPMQPTAKEEFETLTSMSDRLLDSGVLDIYTSNRENLLSSMSDANMDQRTAAENGVFNAAVPEHFENEHLAADNIDLDMFDRSDDPVPSSEIYRVKSNKDVKNENVERRCSMEEEEKPAPNKIMDSMLQGFYPLEEDSKYLYNSTLQAYYCCRSELFGDAKTGKWYRVDPETGTFIQQ